MANENHEMAMQNTDRELWRETEDDYYAPSLHVTEGGSIGVNVGGTMIIMPIRDWHALAMQPPDKALNASNPETWLVIE